MFVGSRQKTLKLASEAYWEASMVISLLGAKPKSAGALNEIWPKEASSRVSLIGTEAEAPPVDETATLKR